MDLWLEYDTIVYVLLYEEVSWCESGMPLTEFKVLSFPKDSRCGGEGQQVDVNGSQTHLQILVSPWDY